MNEKRSSPDFSRWAITGVIAPIVVIVILRFAIAPFVWPYLAAELGNALGYIFIWYLLGVAIAATIWKIWNEKKHQPQVDATQQGDRKQ
jgi:hypothetical protein